MSSRTKRKCNSSKSIGIFIDDTEEDISHEINSDENETANKYIVEPYLVSILRPLNIIQNVFFCAKYRISGHVIKPISRLYSALSVIFYFLLMTYLYYMFFTTKTNGGGAYFERFVLDIYDYTLVSIGGFTNFITNIKQKYNNVLYVLKIQNVHRILKLNECCFKRTIIANWICVLAINCFHISWTLIYFFAFNDVNILNTLSAYTNVRFDVNVIYATRCLRLMTEALKVWTSDLQKSAYIYDSQDNNYWDSMFQCYVDITEVFLIVEKTFHPMILFYLVYTSSYSLMDIWVRVKMRPTVPNKELQFQYSLLTFSCLTWVMKNLVIITFLCVECEKYYSAMKDVESTCSQMTTSERSSANKKRFCKNILRVQDATFSKFRVCGLFAVDASLPLRVIAFITTYTIVILQFVFL